MVIRTTVATPVTDGRLSFFIGSSIADGSEFSFMPLGAELVQLRFVGPGRGREGTSSCSSKVNRRRSPAGSVGIGQVLRDREISSTTRLTIVCISTRNAIPLNCTRQIEAAMKRVIVRFLDSTHVTVDGLTIAYTGAHGANGSYCKHGTIRNCEFLWIGGSHLYTRNGSPVRYGNGVEFWDGCEGMTVENNYFENIYDTAMTNQGRGEGEVKDMVWRNNKTFRCEQAYEIWFSNPKMKVDRLFVTGNECVDSGYGWGHVQRPNKNGCHFLAYTLKCRIGDIRYERNTLNNARDAIIWFTNSRLSEFCIDNNTYIQDCEAPDKTELFRWSGLPAEGVTFDAYRDATGNDRESVLKTSNPLDE